MSKRFDLQWKEQRDIFTLRETRRKRSLGAAVAAGRELRYPPITAETDQPWLRCTQAGCILLAAPAVRHTSCWNLWELMRSAEDQHTHIQNHGLLITADTVTVMWPGFLSAAFSVGSPPNLHCAFCPIRDVHSFLRVNLIVLTLIQFWWTWSFIMTL